MDMSVGVTEGRTAVGGTDVNVGVFDATIGGEEVGVDKTSTEKVQASSNSALNTKTIIGRYHLRCFIAFSLSALANKMESDKTYYPRKESVVGISTGNEYTTFVPDFLFPDRKQKAQNGQTTAALKCSSRRPRRRLPENISAVPGAGSGW